MGGKIKVLDEATVNKIAAGEVVERPASVVKELVENSLDAGATSVTVSVEEGGRARISVRDDGHGMSSEDARLAFERHATSKIEDAEDLETVSTYGFRGEALSSIAAVSRTTLRTREHGSEEGTQVVVRSGRVESQGPTGCPEGTEVLVEDLFGSVPARKKHLKSARIELAHCKDVVVSYILCRPELSFALHSDGETVLVHVPAEGMRGSLAVAFGPEVAEDSMLGEAEDSGTRVEAYMGRLEHNKASPADLRLFVNDRPVRSPRIVSAVVSSYGSKLMKDRYPAGVIRIHIEGPGLDVNVHPTKREVRFADEQRVLDVVRKAVSKAIESRDLFYQYELTRFAERFEPATQVGERSTGGQAQSVLEVETREERGTEPPLIVPLAQVMDTYILAESKGNLLLVDQHAASERVVYESVLRALKTGKEVSQELLSPIVIKLSVSEEKVLEENGEALADAGFKAEPFGRGAVALRTIPTVLGVAQGESAFRNILADLGDMSKAKRLGLDVIWRVACHTAIRAGQTLSQGQMRQLVSELMRTESPYTCEHGRPTMVVLSSADLERLFKRRV